MSQLQVLKCPACGATLSVIAGGATATCTFCGTSVVLPADMRAQPAAPAGLTPEQVEKIMQLKRAGKLIDAIKMYRQITFAGLAEAKKAVEQM